MSVIIIMENLHIQLFNEYQIHSSLKEQVACLLQDCFHGYPTQQTYLKQLPSFRLLAYQQDTLIGHLAVEHRVVNNDGQVAIIFGITDLCVDQAFQHNRVATQLLTETEKLGQENGIDFLLLVAKDFGLYLRQGFEQADNKCRWLLIQKHSTFGVASRKLGQALMVKQLSSKQWRPGLVDFLGHVF